MSVESGGTVFDIGYQRYTGEREGRWRSRRAVCKDGVRVALGIGRGAKAKLMPWLFIAALCALAFIWALIAGAVNRAGGAGTAEQLNLPSHGDFYGYASIMLFLFGAMAAPELLTRDRREGVISLYLVRPLTGTDYVAARWVAFCAVLLGAAWLPQCILLLGLAFGDPAPIQYLRDNWLDIPRFLVSGLVFAVYCTTLALVTAAFTTRRATASVFLVGMVAISTPFTVGVASELEGTVGQWLSMFNLTGIPVYVNDLIFGEASAVTRPLPASALSGEVHVAWYLLWTALPAVILWARYRRLTA